MRRDWMSIGAEYVERLGEKEIAAEIEQLDWQDVPQEGSSTLTLAAMPGMAIKETIREFQIPRVSKIAISGFSRPEFYPGFYGIEGNYNNGRVRIYVLDTGVGITPICADVYEEEEVAA